MSLRSAHLSMPDSRRKHQPYAGQTEIPDLDNAIVTIETTVQNMGTAPEIYMLRHTLRDASGNIAGTAEVPGHEIQAKASDMTAANITVKNPHLWSCEDPHLYTVTTEVIVRDSTVDTYLTATGIRHIAFDPDKRLHPQRQSCETQGSEHASGSCGNRHRHSGRPTGMAPAATEEIRMQRIPLKPQSHDTADA